MTSSLQNYVKYYIILLSMSLAEMKERTKNTWIYLHDSIVRKLLKSEGVKCEEGIHNCRILSWEATDEYPTTQVVISSF